MYEAESQQSDDLGVTPLGSGSDYTVFLQRIGVCKVFRTRLSQGLTMLLSGRKHERRLWFDSARSCLPLPLSFRLGAMAGVIWRSRLLPTREL